MPARFTLLLLAILLSSSSFPGSSAAWTVDNQTDFVFAAIVEGDGAGVHPLSPNKAFTCDTSSNACTGVIDNYISEHQEFYLTLSTAAEGTLSVNGSACRVLIRGGGDVVIEQYDRSGFELGSQSPLPPVFRCTSTARLDPSNCLPFPAPPMPDGVCVGPSGSVQQLDQRPKAQIPGTPRDIRFLATGDPQFWDDGSATASSYNSSASRTLNRMTLEIQNDPDIRGAVISGDLTQDVKDWDYETYLDHLSPWDGYFFDGLGNHDMECAPGFDCGSYTGSGDHLSNTNAIMQFVYSHTNEGMIPRVTPKTSAGFPHYSWDWDDIHFVQVNLYPGDGVDLNAPGTHGTDGSTAIDPLFSLTYLNVDLAQFAPITPDPLDPSKKHAKPVVVIHHYQTGGTSEDAWSTEARLAAWNVMATHNVIATLTGHAHTGASEEWSARDWDQPTGGLARANGLAADIPDFNAGTARGDQAVPNPFDGAYLDIAIDDTDVMTLTRRNDLGAQIDSEEVEFETCWFDDTGHFFDLRLVSYDGAIATVEVHSCMKPGETHDVRIYWGILGQDENYTLSSEVQTFQHTYTTPGNYTVGAFITRDRGRTTTQMPKQDYVNTPEPTLALQMVTGLALLAHLSRRRAGRREA